MPLVTWIMQNLQTFSSDGVLIGGSAMIFGTTNLVAAGGVSISGKAIMDGMDFVVPLRSCPPDTCASKGKIGFACLNRSTNSCDCASNFLVPPKTGVIRINTSYRSAYYRRLAVLPSSLICYQGIQKLPT